MHSQILDLRKYVGVALFALVGCGEEILQENLIQGLEQKEQVFTIDEDRSSYTISGSVSGLSGTIRIENNHTDRITMTTNGSFTFSKSLKHGLPYTVEVTVFSSGIECKVINGEGIILEADVTNVEVTCAGSGRDSDSDIQAQ